MIRQVPMPTPTRRLVLLAIALCLWGCTATPAPSAGAPTQTGGGLNLPSVLPSTETVTQDATASASALASSAPALGSWQPTASMSVARKRHTATLLPDGRVLVAGGVDSNDDSTTKALASAELYDPRTRPFVSHARGTELVIEHIETMWCPSILSEDLTRVVPGSADPDGRSDLKRSAG